MWNQRAWKSKYQTRSSVKGLSNFLIIPLALQSTTALTTTESATAADLVISAEQLSHIEDEDVEAVSEEFPADTNNVMARVTSRTSGGGLVPCEICEFQSCVFD